MNMLKGAAKGATVAPTTENGEEDLSFWGPAVLLAPIVPVLFSLVVIVVGQFLVLAEPTCESGGGEHGCFFMQGAVASAYLLILVFSWIFTGTTVHVYIRGKPKKILRPFTRLRSIVVCYFVIFLISFGIFLYGTVWVATAEDAFNSFPLLYGFSCFCIIFYWIMIIILTISLIQIKKAGQNKGLRATVKTPTGGIRSSKDDKGSKNNLLENSEEWFSQKFEDESDPGDTIESDKLGRLISSLGITMSEGEISTITDQLDTEGTGDIGRHDIWIWFFKTGKLLKLKDNTMSVEEIDGSEND